MFRRLLSICMALFVPALVGHAQIISDGDFEDLPIGMAPDCDAPAGAWYWPDHYVAAGLCETDPAQFTVVLEHDGAGHCLSHHVDLDAGQPNGNMHLPNLFDRVIEEAIDPVAIVVFDIMVPEAGVGGGNVYVGGDHSGNGWSSTLDRAVQIGWHADGTLTVPNAPECPLILVDPYPVDVWQTVRLEIDLASDTYDMFWAERGDPFIQVVADRAFKADALLDHLDRFTIAHFEVGSSCYEPGSSHSFFDNLEVSVCLADTNLDGVVDVDDLLGVLAAWNGDDPAADIDDDGVVAVDDLLLLLGAWGPCS